MAILQLYQTLMELGQPSDLVLTVCGYQEVETKQVLELPSILLPGAILSLESERVVQLIDHCLNLDRIDILWLIHKVRPQGYDHKDVSYFPRSLAGYQFLAEVKINPSQVRILERGSLELVRSLIQDQPVLARDLNTACETNTPEVVQFLIEELKIEPSDNPVKLACRSGNLEVFKYLVQRYQPDLVPLMCIAAEHSFKILEYLVRECKVRPNPRHLGSACHQKSPEAVQLLMDTGLQPTGDHLTTALIFSDFPVIQLLVESKIQPTGVHLVAALEYQTSSSIRLLLERGAKPGPVHLLIACYNSSVDVFQDLLDFKAEPITYHLEVLCRRGYTDIVRCLVEKYHIQPGPECLVINSATTPKLIRYLVTTCGLKPGSELADEAIKHQNSEVLKCLMTEYGLQPTISVI